MNIASRLNVNTPEIDSVLRTFILDTSDAERRRRAGHTRQGERAWP
jgi:hypothetical protein